MVLFVWFETINRDKRKNVALVLLRFVLLLFVLEPVAFAIFLPSYVGLNKFAGDIWYACAAIICGAGILWNKDI